MLTLWLQLSCDYEVTVYMQLADEKGTTSNVIFWSIFIMYTRSEGLEDPKYCFTPS